MNNKITKISFNSCSRAKKASFSNSNCIMPISVGVRMHEGEIFLMTMNLIGEHFKECTLLVDDSVQRYTMNIDEPNTTIEELHRKAVLAGDEWLKRNKSSYESLKIPYKIMRWDDWRTHKDFSKYYSLVEEAYNSDAEYRQAVHDNIDAFISNNYKVDQNFDSSHALDCCLKYLKEECSVMCLWALSRFDFEVYPSGRNKAMAATYEKIIKPLHPSVLKSISLYFM